MSSKMFKKKKSKKYYTLTLHDVNVGYATARILQYCILVQRFNSAIIEIASTYHYITYDFFF